MANNKLAIIGGSGLYDVEEFKDRDLLDINTPWGKPSDQILKTKYNGKEVYFLPRHILIHFVYNQFFLGHNLIYKLMSF